MLHEYECLFNQMLRFMSNGVINVWKKQHSLKLLNVIQEITPRYLKNLQYLTAVVMSKSD